MFRNKKTVGGLHCVRERQVATWLEDRKGPNCNHSLSAELAWPGGNGGNFSTVSAAGALSTRPLISFAVSWTRQFSEYRLQLQLCKNKAVWIVEHESLSCKINKRLVLYYVRLKLPWHKLYRAIKQGLNDFEFAEKKKIFLSTTSVLSDIIWNTGCHRNCKIKFLVFLGHSSGLFKVFSLDLKSNFLHYFFVHLLFWTCYWKNILV